MLLLIYFITIALIVSYIDIKKSLIPDVIILPAIVVLLGLKYFYSSLNLYDFIAVAIVLCVFLVPIVFDMAFGGGDLRFGAFCALFSGLESIGLFILFAGLLHLVILGLLKKRSFGFAPAMSISTLLAYMIGNL